MTAAVRATSQELARFTVGFDLWRPRLDPATAHWHDLPPCTEPDCDCRDPDLAGLYPPHTVRELHSHPYTDPDHDLRERA